MSTWTEWASLLGELIALAAVVALSPFTVIPAVLLVVHSDHPRAVGLSFLSGWLLSKAAITVAFLRLPDVVHPTDDPAPVWSGWGRIAVGIALLITAVVYGGRPRSTYTSPRWLERMRRLSPWAAALAGAALTVVNFKIVLACAAAGYAIGTAGLGIAGTALTVVFFTVAGGSTAALPIVAYALWSHRVDRHIERFRQWLQRRQLVLTVATTALIGVALLFSGVRALL